MNVATKNAHRTTTTKIGPGLALKTFQKKLLSLNTHHKTKYNLCMCIVNRSGGPMDSITRLLERIKILVTSH